ncbi:MAG: T9SS type A sorting domain-containing protein [candidate division Zixibacteria bacterium]|nr:T9SS type A sorting domain-containing protein [candidate division Zixibacteria bacterium]
MKRTGILKFVLILLLIGTVQVAFANDGSTLGFSDPSGSVDNNNSTLCYPTDTFYICLGDAIYDTLTFEFGDMSDPSISMAIHDGPGELSWEVSDKLYGYYTYIPEGDSEFLMQYLVVGPGTDSTIETYKYVVYTDDPPLYEDQYKSAKFCDSGEIRSFQVYANDPESEPLTFELISGVCDLNTTTGWIHYIPDTSGVYTFEVAVYDDCHADTAMIQDTITLNSYPELITGDTTIYVCDSGEVCFDIEAYDMDGDSILFAQVGGPGVLTRLDIDKWQQCFETVSEDSTTYTFYYWMYDDCDPNEAELFPNNPKCLTDSLHVTVIYAQPPTIVCPEAQEFFICEPETFCFDVDADPGTPGPLTFNILSGNATIDGSTVCITADSDADFDVVVEVVDICDNSDTCTIPISIESNQPPNVNMADDFEVDVCTTETICLDAFVSDPDNNLESASVNYGNYDNSTGQVCFEADTAGVYTMIVTAVDSCGASAADTTLVTVIRPPDPEVNLPDDFTANMCGEAEICMDVEIIADSISSINALYPGYFDVQTNQLCFMPDTAGVYTLVLEVVGECSGSEASDTVNVTVLYPPEPFVDLGEDFTRNLCSPEEICIDVSTIEIYETFEINYGTFDPETEQLCFIPDTSGTYTLTATVTDSCDMSAVDTVLVTIDLNSPPVISHMSDSSLYLCYPQDICLDVTVDDPDNDIDTIFVNRGTYNDGHFCFVPYDSGTYELIITAIDECGNVAADTALIMIETDIGISLECPNDTTVFTCTLVDTFCIPFEGVEGNVDLQISGINTWYDSLNKTICFWSECSNVNNITVTATTPCNSYECSFAVTVLCNNDPLVILPPDTSISTCQAEEICLPAGISDQDGNLENVIVSYGIYNPTIGRVCFMPDTSGIYEISVTAIDSCGATDSDGILVNIIGNDSPEVNVINPDTVYSQCEPEEICLSVEVNDINGNLDTVYAEGGNYDSETDEVCIMPDGSGEFCGHVIAIDECGLADTADFCVTVETGDYVSIVCDFTDPLTVDLCDSQEVCVPLVVEGSGYTINPSFGSWSNNQLCFMADTSGTYNITVVGTAECNVDTCVVSVIVTIAEPVEITCPPDTSVLLCGSDTACFDFSVSGPYETVTANGEAYIDSMSVCVPIMEPGTQTISLIASGNCGADTCDFTVSAAFNTPPTIIADEIDTISACELQEICIPVSANDIDNNIIEVTSPQGDVYGDTLVCFVPENFGTHLIEVTVTDECGETATDTVEVVILIGGEASIICPNPVYVDTICSPDTICVAAPVSPSSATVTVSPIGSYNPATGLVCIPISESDTINITMTAEAPCGTDTCQFAIEVVRAEPTTISCPGTIDTLLCLADSQTLCYPVSITGTDVSVSVEPFGSFDGDNVCLDVVEPGTYDIDVIADGFCNIDTCHTTIEVSADQAPILTVPSFQTFSRCLDDTDLICLDGIYATDVESSVTLTKTCGVGDFTLVGTDSGSVCFLPDSFGVYEFCFEAFDGCNTVEKSFQVEVVEEEGCDVCVELWMETDSCTVVGVNQEVKIYIDTKESIGGFDLLLSYDASVVSFNAGWIEGTEIEGWEYFVHRLGDGNCGESCPSGLLRFVGIADMNNGASHPPVETLTPDGLFIMTEFYIANDQNLGDQFLPINFVWFDCGDNTFSDPSGNVLYVEKRIFNPEGILVWDEDDDINFPESARPFGVGTPDDCIQEEEGKPSPIRCIVFNNGGICVIHPDSIDERGDVNLNGIAYEIGDAVVLSNYFIFGLSAFTVSVSGQIAASDVNADGITLSVADLVYLIRVIVGDASPVPKVVSIEDGLKLSTDIDNNLMRVTADAVMDIGAAYLIYDIEDGLNVEDVKLGDDAKDMDLMWGHVDGQLKILVYSLGTESIDPGAQNILEIPVSGAGAVNLSHVEVVNYQGQPYEIAAKAEALPSSFALRQNYPNPFNPTTTISFDLSHEVDWTLQIYSITGRLVREYDGYAEAGTINLEWDGTSRSGGLVASGVYFYRLQAGSFNATKKMIMLK